MSEEMNMKKAFSVLLAICMVVMLLYMRPVRP